MSITVAIQHIVSSLEYVLRNRIVRITSFYFSACFAYRDIL